MSKYDIKPLETDKQNIPQKASTKLQIMPRFPSSFLLSGKSGSGKTQLLLNMLSRTELIGNYYHKILVFSPTAGDGLDDTYKILKLPKENFIKKFDVEILQIILNNRKEQIKKDGIEMTAKKDRVILIFDDMISENIMNSKEILKMFTLLRHYLISVCVLTQSYKKVPRTIRINANFICVFPSLESEIIIMLEEITPSGILKKDFRNIINYCTKGRYDFMTINNHADPDKRIRKNLNEIIDLNNLDKYK